MKATLIFCALCLAGCSSLPQTATTVQGQVEKACSILQPVAQDAQLLYSMNPQVDLAIQGLNTLCTTTSQIDTTSLQTLVQTTIPAAIKALASSAGTNPTVQAVVTALGLAQVALNLAIISK